jgi:DNA primase
MQTDGYPPYRRDRGRGPHRVLHIMTARRLFLARVKEEAPFEQILDHYGVKTRGAGAKRMALCPFHPDTKPSCSIHLERKIFYCFGCGAKGSVLDFVAKIENVSIPEAAERVEHICRIPHQGAVSERQTQNRGDEEVSDRPLSPLPFRLMLDTSHPYIAGRGIGPELAAMFGLGYCGEEVTHRQVPSLSEAMNAASIAQNWNPDRRVVVLNRYGEVVDGDIVKKSTSCLKSLPKSKE